jgi:hypothetical protein
VNEILSTPHSSSAWPVRLSPWSTVSTPSGSPAASKSLPTNPPEKGVAEEGLSSTAFPAISACTVGLRERMKGPFQGLMTPTTPSGL